MVRNRSLVEHYGKLPAGMSSADVQAVLDFLFGAFDKQTAKQIEIFHPYVEAEDEEVPRLTIAEFCRWLQVAAV